MGSSGHTPIVAGIDLGTSALKCGLWDADGNQFGAARVPYPSSTELDMAEQDAADWWCALVQAVRLATSSVDPKQLVAIGICGHAPSPVFVDAELGPVAPVLTWADQRPQKQLGGFLDSLGDRLHDGGTRLGAHVALRGLWLGKNRPKSFARADRVLHSWDYLIARMTGKRAITGGGCQDIFLQAGLRVSLVPELEVRPGEVVGSILQQSANEIGLPSGLPVVACGIDSFAGSVGSGISRPGDACINGGSSTIVSLLAKPPPAGRFEWCGIPLHSRPLRNSGRVLEWALAIAAGDSNPRSLLEAAAGIDIDPEPVLLLHRLSEAREAEIKKLLNELSERHDRIRFIRTIIDAISLVQLQALLSLNDAYGPVRQIRGIGGQAKHPALNQLRSDTFGRPIAVPRFTEGGALGSAMIAAIAVGLVSNAERAAEAMARVSRVYEPSTAKMTIYRELYSEFCSMAAPHSNI
jgi:xylulokinase